MNPSNSDMDPSNSDMDPSNSNMDPSNLYSIQKHSMYYWYVI